MTPRHADRALPRDTVAPDDPARPVGRLATRAPRRPSRRRLVAALAGLLAGRALPGFAGAFPERPIRLVVPFGPGGLADITTRLVGQRMADRMGQQVVIDNKPGAGGIPAAMAVLTAPRDGYTLAVFANGTAIAKSLVKLPYDPESAFVPIGAVAWFDLVLLTRPDAALKTLRDVLAEAARRELTFGTIAVGSTQNLSAELFKSAARVRATIVPYKGTPDVMTALMRGEIDVGFESYAALKGPIDAGTLRVVASTGAHRSPSLPAVPTVREAGVERYEVTGWNALYAPAGTPPTALAILHRHLTEVLALPDVQTRLIELGTSAAGGSPADMAALFRRDTAKWAAVIRQAGIQRQ